jgi:hypothetical protein
MKFALLIISFIFITFAENKSNRIYIETPIGKPIKAIGNYSINLATYFYSNVILGNNDVIDKSYVSYSKGSSESDLVVSGKKATMFNSVYQVLVDNKNFLILFKYDEISNITEMLNFNKITGVGINTKTHSKDVGGDYPTTASYVLISK